MRGGLRHQEQNIKYLPAKLSNAVDIVISIVRIKIFQLCARNTVSKLLRLVESIERLRNFGGSQPPLADGKSANLYCWWLVAYFTHRENPRCILLLLLIKPCSVQTSPSRDDCITHDMTTTTKTTTHVTTIVSSPTKVFGKSVILTKLTYHIILYSCVAVVNTYTLVRWLRKIMRYTCQFSSSIKMLHILYTSMPYIHIRHTYRGLNVVLTRIWCCTHLEG